MQPLVISAGKELNSRFGVYRHSDLIGVPYGSKVGSRNGKGFIHVLRPTPELWTLALPHRTQILYLADIAFVTSWLDIKPGSKVIEAGERPPSYALHTLSRGHVLHQGRDLWRRKTIWPCIPGRKQASAVVLASIVDQVGPRRARRGVVIPDTHWAHSSYLTCTGRTRLRLAV